MDIRVPWLDIIGWAGSGLLVYSLMQARVLRFRVVNLVACVILTGFNAALAIWPMVAMNVVLCLVNAWHIRALLRSRHDDATYAVIEVGPQDAYLRHVLTVHRPDISKYQPDFSWDDAGADAIAFLVQRRDETVGVVLVHDRGGGVAQVALDYVTPRFRDFSPGEFVWKRSSVLRDHGFDRVVTAPNMVAPYYGRLGFTRLENGAYELEL